MLTNIEFISILIIGVDSLADSESTIISYDSIIVW